MTGYLFAMLPGYAPVLRVGIAIVVLVAVVFARSGYERRRGPSRLRLSVMALICGPTFGLCMAWLNAESPGIPGDIYERCGGIGAIAGIIAAAVFLVASPSSGRRASNHSRPASPVYDRDLDGGP